MAYNISTSSNLTTTSPSFSRLNGDPGTYYYAAYQVIASSTGEYRFRSNSSVDTCAYLYYLSFIPTNPSLNLLLFDDDSAGNGQFQFITTLEKNVIYVLVFTTFNALVKAPYTLIASGPSSVSLTRMSNPSTTTTVRMNTTTAGE